MLSSSAAEIGSARDLSLRYTGTPLCWLSFESSAADVWLAPALLPGHGGPSAVCCRRHGANRARAQCVAGAVLCMPLCMPTWFAPSYARSHEILAKGAAPRYIQVACLASLESQLLCIQPCHLRRQCIITCQMCMMALGFPSFRLCPFITRCAVLSGCVFARFYGFTTRHTRAT